MEDYKKKLPRHAQAVMIGPVTDPQLSASSEAKLEEGTNDKSLAPAAAASASEPSLSSPLEGKLERDTSNQTVAHVSASSRSDLSLFQANLLVAMLAGFWARKADGHPGPKLLARGLILLAAIVSDRRLSGRASSPPAHPPKRSRKPG